MKKLKLVTSILAIPMIGMTTIPITNCAGKSKISKIEITTKPTKLSYIVGEKLDLTGMVVTSTTHDGVQKDVTSQCTTTPDINTPLTKQDTKVVVTHTSSGTTCEFNIEIVDPSITSINVKTLPFKTAYGVGEKLDLTGMVVKANWDDGRTPTDITSQCTTTPDINTPLTKQDTKVVVAHKASGKTCEFSISVVDVTFQNDTWANVISYADQGLDKLKEVYDVDSFIGLERIVSINGYDHVVRVIGEEHDTLAGTTNKAALTFELVTLLSNSYGNAMKCKQDATNNKDYTNSILRWNLNGDGSGTKPEGVWENSALSMLPSELKNGIKKVNKHVATYNTDESKYEVKSDGYNDKLFPLTYTEMDQAGSEYALVEGEPYHYWELHNNNADRIKKDANGVPRYYTLTSPETSYSLLSWGVDDDGKVSSMTVSQSYGVSFGFCI